MKIRQVCEIVYTMVELRDFSVHPRVDEVAIRDHRQTSYREHGRGILFLNANLKIPLLHDIIIICK